MSYDGEDEAEDEGEDNCVCSPCLRKDKLWFNIKSIVFGQLLSICLVGTGITSTLLSEKFSVNTPTTQNFANYFLLSLVYTSWLASRNDDVSILQVLAKRGWKYFILALVDVQANFLVVKAYQYTSMSSIQLLDCFVIPVVLVLAFFFLGTRYLVIHIVGVVISIIGVTCVVWGDFDQGTASFKGENRLLGDMLCLASSTLYGITNVGEEAFVKSSGRVEYLGMVGLFGTIISGVQLAILERDELVEVDWTNYKIVLLYIGFALCMFTFYSFVAVLIERTSAAFFNLSMLTADFYTLIINTYLFEHKFHYLYGVSFMCCSIGVILYSSRNTVQGDRPVISCSCATCQCTQNCCLPSIRDQVQTDSVPAYLTPGPGENLFGDLSVSPQDSNTLNRSSEYIPFNSGHDAVVAFLDPMQSTASSMPLLRPPGAHNFANNSLTNRMDLSSAGGMLSSPRGMRRSTPDTISSVSISHTDTPERQFTHHNVRHNHPINQSGGGGGLQQQQYHRIGQQYNSITEPGYLNFSARLQDAQGLTDSFPLPPQPGRPVSYGSVSNIALDVEEGSADGHLQGQSGLSTSAENVSTIDSSMDQRYAANIRARTFAGLPTSDIHPSLRRPNTKGQTVKFCPKHGTVIIDEHGRARVASISNGQYDPGVESSS